MKFTVPRYEVKYRGEEYWQDISEIDLMLKLYDNYDQVTPLIRQMLQGQKVQTLEAVYRLKKQDNVKFLNREDKQQLLTGSNE